MATFTSEALVRKKMQLTDATLAPADLVAQSIDDAHATVLAELDPEVDVEDPEDGLVLGETLLAGAHVLRSLASKDAFEQRKVSVGGQRIEPGARYDALMDAAAGAEDQAWDALAPYLAPGTERAPADVTDSQPVLGDA